MVFCSACLLVCRKVISTFVHYLTWRNITKCSQRYRAKNCPDCFFGTAPRHHLFCGRDKSIYVHFTIKKWITPLNKKTYENYNPYIYIYVYILCTLTDHIPTKRTCFPVSRNSWRPHCSSGKLDTKGTFWLLLHLLCSTQEDPQVRWIPLSCIPIATWLVVLYKQV